MEQVSLESERRGESFDSLVEMGLRLILAQSRTTVTLPLSKMGGGVLPGVDLSDNAALLDLIEPPD